MANDRTNSASDLDPVTLICPECGPENQLRPFRWANETWLCSRCFFIHQKKTTMVSLQRYETLSGADEDGLSPTP